MRKPDKVSVFVSLSESNGAEDDEVVVNVEIGSGLIFEQSLVIGVYVEKLAVDFNFSAGDELAVENLVEVFENVIGRNIPDVRRNGIGYSVAFKGENLKQRVGDHQKSLPCFEIEAFENKGNFRVLNNSPDIFCCPNVHGRNKFEAKF